MASTAVYQRAMRRIVGLCESPSDAMSLRLGVLDELAAVGFDAHAWLLTDPTTTVGCSPLADVPCLAELPRLIRLKYVTQLNRWTTIVDPPLALLSVATGGDLGKSLLWRELLHRYDVVDVASLVFEDKFGCWGFLDLWRSGTSRPFDDDEASFLSAICAPIAVALRRCQADTFHAAARGPTSVAGPMVLLLSDDLQVLGQTPETDQYLRVLVPPSVEGTAIPAIAYNVAAQLVAVESGVDGHEPCARTHLADGVWVTVRAARLGDARAITDRNIAVSIESTAPNDRLSMFAMAFGLSAREREILIHLATGMDTRALADRVFLSEHTVQDHLKSIFSKTGVNSRPKLLSSALGS